MKSHNIFAIAAISASIIAAGTVRAEDCLDEVYGSVNATTGGKVQLFKGKDVQLVLNTSLVRAQDCQPAIDVIKEFLAAVSEGLSSESKSSVKELKTVAINDCVLFEGLAFSPINWKSGRETLSLCFYSNTKIGIDVYTDQIVLDIQGLFQPSVDRAMSR